MPADITPEQALLLGAAAHEAMQPREPDDLQLFFIQNPQAVAAIEEELSGYAASVLSAAVALYRQPTNNYLKLLKTPATSADTMNLLASLMGGGLSEDSQAANQGPNAQPNGLLPSIPNDEA